MALHLYDPLAPDFYDRRAARAERDRTFHICSDCRVCVKLCPSFKSLFEMIDDLGGTEHVDELADASTSASSTSATSASSATSSARTRRISSRSGGSTSRS